ncbi:MAG: hypothetical protein WAU88_03805 [Candidatus Zixiibacteriota bacterium]
MKIKVVSAPVLAAFASFLFGCAGTTHHFLPPRPLASGEGMVSVSWHFDFNNWTGHDIIPSYNFYLGLGGNTNLGVGCNIVDITHVSLATYDKRGDDSYGVLFAHINQIVGNAYNNPYFEAGYGVSSQKSGSSLLLAGGLAYGNGMSYGMIPSTPRERAERDQMKDFTHKRSILPFVRATYTGSDFGGSLNYYPGLSHLIRSNVINAITSYNDTILFIPHQEMRSVGGPGDGSSPALTSETWGSLFIYSTHDSLWLYSGGLNEFINPEHFATWSPLVRSLEHKYSYYSIRRKKCFVDSRQLVADWKAGHDIVIMRFPSDAAELVPKPSTFPSDLSLGISIFGHWTDRQ